MMYVDKNKSQKNNQGMARSPSGGRNVKILENMDEFYKLVWSWAMEEQGDIPFPCWKVVHDYQVPVGPTSLSSHFEVVLLNLKILLNYRVEQAVIINDIIQDRIEFPEDNKIKL